MSQTPLESLDLYGRQELQTILASNQAAGLAPETTPSVLGALAADAAKGISGHEKSRTNALAECIEAATTLFARIGLEVPKQEELEAIGMEIDGLYEYFNELERDNMEPTMLLVPYLPYRGYYSWESVYKTLIEDKSIPNNPLKDTNDYCGIAAENITTYWDELHTVDQQTLRGLRAHSYLKGNDRTPIEWQLCVLPATNEPEDAVNALRSRDDMPTVSAYITLQATRIQAGKEPVDVDCFTQLAGTVDHGLNIVCGSWTKLSDGQVLFTKFHATDIVDVAKVRPVVWG